MAVARTRGDLCNLVRTQLDVDLTELSNATISPWLDDGYDRVLSMDAQWPFLEEEWSFTSIVNDVDYTKASLAAAHPSLYEIGQVRQIIDLTYPLSPVDLTFVPHEDARKWFGSGTAGGTVPAYWSEWKGSIFLWPAPTAGRSYVVSGFRRGKWDSADAAVVDADSRLHTSIFYFGCAMAYAQQEDDALSGVYMGHFESSRKQAHADIMIPPQHRPLVMGGTCVDRYMSNVRLVP